MTSKLNVRYWLYASAAVFVVYSVLGFLFGRLIVLPLFPVSPSPTGQPGGEWVFKPLVYLGRVVVSLMIAFIYTRGYERKPGIGEGARYGLWMGILLFAPAFFWRLGSPTISTEAAFVTTILDLLNLIACGLVVNLTYRPQEGKPAM